MVDGHGAHVAAWAADVPVTLDAVVQRVVMTRDGVEVVTPLGTISGRTALVTVSPNVLGAPTRCAPARVSPGPPGRPEASLRSQWRWSRELSLARAGTCAMIALEVASGGPRHTPVGHVRVFRVLWW